VIVFLSSDAAAMMTGAEYELPAATAHVASKRRRPAPLLVEIA
jgi:hypothetical protein